MVRVCRHSKFKSTRYSTQESRFLSYGYEATGRYVLNVSNLNGVLYYSDVVELLILERIVIRQSNIAMSNAVLIFTLF